MKNLNYAVIGVIAYFGYMVMRNPTPKANSTDEIIDPSTKPNTTPFDVTDYSITGLVRGNWFPVQSGRNEINGFVYEIQQRDNTNWGTAREQYERDVLQPLGIDLGVRGYYRPSTVSEWRITKNGVSMSNNARHFKSLESAQRKFRTLTGGISLGVINNANSISQLTSAMNVPTVSASSFGSNGGRTTW